MTYDEFKAYVRQNGLYETMYEDSDGRYILVIKVIEAYSLFNDIVKSEIKKRENNENNS